MKDTNLPETQLRSWRPRRPSTSLKRKIFAKPPDAEALTGWSLRWLGPVAACLFLAMTVLRQGNIPDTSGRQETVGMILSNRIAYVADGVLHGQNDLASATFGWTNAGSSTSSIPPFNRAR